jgi:hypothetical protein
MIKLARDGYKLGIVANDVFVVPRKQWSRPHLIVRRRGGLIVSSLIVLKL